MDFIERFPKSQGKIVIMVGVDRLTKSAHFMSLSHLLTAKNVAQVFLNNIFKLHGLPETIMSDRDSVSQVSFGKSCSNYKEPLYIYLKLFSNPS